MRRPLQQWLLSSHVFILLLPLGALLATGALSGDLRTQARIGMLDQGALISLLIDQHLGHTRAPLEPSPALDALVAEAAAAAHTSALVLDTELQPVARAGTLPAEAASPEAHAALAGEQSWGRHGAVLTVTNPIRHGDAVVGVILLARSPRQTLDALRHMAPRLSAGLLAALLLTLAVSASAGLVQSRALRALSSAARRIAAGDLSAQQDLSAPLASPVEEIHVLAGAFANMTDQLQARLAYIHEFASNVSHEFKTPISTLRGTLELLQDDADMPPEQRTRFLENAHSELLRMSSLVDGLLALARAEEASAREPLALQALLEDVVSRYPEATLTGQAADIRADGRQVEALVTNLLENALQHGAPPITVAAFTTSEQTGFTVSDAGAGISEANLARLFDRFFTTDRRQGTGLGLALARAICRAHGGDIAAQSAPGETTFTVTLPRSTA